MPEDTARKVVQLKAAEYGEKGAIKAVFATLNAIDHDGDMILPGAIGEQRVRMSAYGHRSWGGELPVGKGRVYESGNDAIFEGQFFLTTTPGRDTYETVKAMGDLQEWSFALPEIESEMRTTPEGQKFRAIKKVRVPEVSPVLLGAGVNTRTLDVKQVKTAIGAHSTATDDGAWDAGANERRVLGDKPASYYAKVYAWKDPEGEVGVKSTYKFPHHFVGEDGDPGKASVRACSAGIAALNGGRGGTKIPDVDRKGVWGHLARHLTDADQEPPELRAEMAEPGDMKLIDHVEYVLVQVSDVTERLRDVSEMRSLQNRGPSKATMARAGALASALKDAARMIEQAGQKQAEMDRLWLEFAEITTKGRG